MTFQHNPNATLAHNSADEIRYQIDQEIEALNSKIRTLKTRRNTLAPISRLPPEILCKTFALTISDPLLDDRTALNWIRVSYVSRHWREATLGCPSLWGNLVFTRPKWCEEMLKRSKMASLVVKADLDYLSPNAMEFVRLAMLQGPRIRELHLSGTRIMIENLLFVVYPLQVPMIHSLSLSVTMSMFLHGLRQPFILPKSMLNGETPHLRRLDICQCDVDWDTPLFNGLTSLTIHAAQSFAKPTIEQLVNTLKRMPGLEVLDLKNVLPSSTPGMLALPTENKIHLPRITDLIIGSTISECVSLTTFITIPMTARINFDCAGSDISGIMGIISNPEGISNCVEDSGCPMPKRVIRVLHISAYDNTRVAFFNGWSASHLTHPSDISLRLTLPVGSSIKELQPIITDVCNAFDLEHLCLLKVALLTSIMAKKMWLDIFGALPKLHSIDVARESTETLIAALHDSLSGPFNSGTPKSPTSAKGPLDISQPTLHQQESKAPSSSFPNLKYLTINAYSFGYNGRSDSAINLLRNCMEYRSQHEAKLQELRLRDCYYLNANYVSSLKELVNVDWDGIFQNGEDEDDEDVDSLLDYNYDLTYDDGDVSDLPFFT